jgi:tetratricopeptide (TPR) repeat protein
LAQRETRTQLKAREQELRSDYLGAITLYGKDTQHKDAKVACLSLEGIARCYRTLGNFEQAESAFKQLVEKSGGSASALCSYAEMLLHNEKYAEAKQKAKEAQSADSSYAAQAKHLVDACNNALQWKRKPTRHVVTNLESLNTCYSEWGATPYSAEELVFCSDRPQENPACSGKNQNGNSLLRAFSASSDARDSSLTWQAPQLLPAPINRKGTQAGPFGVAANDPSLLYYTCTGKKGKPTTVMLGKEKVRVVAENLEIKAIRRIADEWDQSEYMVAFDFDDHSVMHPCLSATGDTLYFVSDMPGGYGGTDLWYCIKQQLKTEEGKLYAGKAWGAPVNMGATINTPGNEAFPTIDPAGTFYFSSDKHPGMGGLDIFYTRTQNGKWATPKNMRSPVNSSADDYSYKVDEFHSTVFGRTDTVGYFSSNRLGGKGGDDIYMFLLIGEKLLKPAPAPEPEPDDEPLEPETPIAATDTTPAVDSATMIAATDTILTVDPATGATITTITKTTTTTLTAAASSRLDSAAALSRLDSAAALSRLDSAAASSRLDNAAASSRLDNAASSSPAGATPAGAALAATPPGAPTSAKTADAAQQITFAGRAVDKDTRNPVPYAKICATHDATRTSECKECSKDGTFTFWLKKDARYTVSGFKDGYQSTDPIRILSTIFLQEEEMEIAMTAKKEFSSAREVIDRSSRPLNRLKLLPREFRIQILTNWEETDWEYFTTLRRTHPEFELQYTRRNDGTGMATRFTYGSFVNIGEARRLLRQFISLGYTDAFIAVFEYGKQVESIYVSGSKHTYR